MSSVEFCIFAVLASTAIWPSQSVWNFPTSSTALPKWAGCYAFFWRLPCSTAVILLAPTSICQIWSRLAGYEPLVGDLNKSKTAKHFECIIMQVTGANQTRKNCYLLIWWNNTNDGFRCMQNMSSKLRYCVVFFKRLIFSRLLADYGINNSDNFFNIPVFTVIFKLDFLCWRSMQGIL